MEIFTVYKARPIQGWKDVPFQTTSFEKMREYVNRAIFVRQAAVKVTAIFARKSRFHERREALITIFDIEKDSDSNIEIKIEGASWEELKEVEAFASGVPREYYDRHTLWD